MIKATTPTLILHFSDTLDWENVTNALVTLKNKTNELRRTEEYQINLTKQDLEYDSENNTISFTLTQAQTKNFTDIVEIQMKFKNSEGSVIATNIRELRFSRILNDTEL